MARGALHPSEAPCRIRLLTRVTPRSLRGMPYQAPGLRLGDWASSAPSNADDDEEAAAQLPSEDSWIVGGVVDRPVQATSAPALPGGPAAFPAATHRKLSKVLPGGLEIGCSPPCCLLCQLNNQGGRE